MASKKTKCTAFKHMRLCAKPVDGRYRVTVHGKHDTFTLNKRFRTAEAGFAHVKAFFR